MATLFPFIFIPFCVEFVVLSSVKNRFFRWTPIIFMELLLLIGMVRHWVDPPSFDIIGWKIYLWLIGSVFLGGVLSWGAYVLYDRKKR